MNTTHVQPYGYCQCGCGQLAPVASINRTRGNMVKGQPMRFICGHNPKNPKIILPDYFWQRVDQSDDCWMWQGYKNNYGYGLIGTTGKKTQAHRYSYTLAYGPIPDGLWVLHHCDQPACVRPDHLFLGTTQDNTADMIAKKRASWQS